MPGLRRWIGYALWVLNGYLGGEVSLATSSKATVLITYYRPERMRHLNHQVRNVLK